MNASILEAASIEMACRSRQLGGILATDGYRGLINRARTKAADFRSAAITSSGSTSQTRSRGRKTAALRSREGGPSSSIPTLSTGWLGMVSLPLHPLRALPALAPEPAPALAQSQDRRVIAVTENSSANFEPARTKARVR